MARAKRVSRSRSTTEAVEATPLPASGSEPEPSVGTEADPRTPAEVASTPKFHFADPYHYDYNRPESWRQRPHLFRPQNIHLRRIAQVLLGPPPDYSPSWAADELGWAVGLTAFFRIVDPGATELLIPSRPLLATIAERCEHSRQVEEWLGDLAAWCGTQDLARVEEALSILRSNRLRATSSLLAFLLRVRDGHPYLPELPGPSSASLHALENWALHAVAQELDIEAGDYAPGLFAALGCLYSPSVSAPTEGTEPIAKENDEALDRERDGDTSAAKVGPEARSMNSMLAQHSADFTGVRWRGTTFLFNKRQARIIELLWKEAEKGSFGLGEEALGEAVGSNALRFRLCEAFRVGKAPHPAWGSLVVPTRKGVFRLDLTAEDVTAKEGE